MLGRVEAENLLTPAAAAGSPVENKEDNFLRNVWVIVLGVLIVAVAFGAWKSSNK